MAEAGRGGPLARPGEGRPGRAGGSRRRGRPGTGGPVERPVASRQWTSTSPRTLARSRGWARASARPRTTDRAAAWIAPWRTRASLRASWRSSWICTRSLWSGDIALGPAVGGRRRADSGPGTRPQAPGWPAARSEVRRRRALAPISAPASGPARRRRTRRGGSTGTRARPGSPRTARQSRKPSMPGIRTSERMRVGHGAPRRPRAPPRRSRGLHLEAGVAEAQGGQLEVQGLVVDDQDGARRPARWRLRASRARTTSSSREGSMGLGRKVVFSKAWRRSSSMLGDHAR